jgi:mRNA-degrading endonuclease RelE of RelBE toxin-antitoxin system
VNEPQSHRLAITWSIEARADLRRIDRAIALDILHCIDRYLSTRGDVKKLKPPERSFRLRCGDYRVFFDYLENAGVQILAMRHRREAYR